MKSIAAVTPVVLVESPPPTILFVALIACGLALPVVWAGLIGYGLVSLVGLAF